MARTYDVRLELHQPLRLRNIGPASTEDCRCQSAASRKTWRSATCDTNRSVGVVNVDERALEEGGGAGPEGASAGAEVLKYACRSALPSPTTWSDAMAAAERAERERGACTPCPRSCRPSAIHYRPLRAHLRGSRGRGLMELGASG